MNALQPPSTPAAYVAERQDDEINLPGLFDAVHEARWLIAGVTVFAMLIGAAYAFLSRPEYEASSLIQVEDSKPGAAGALGALGEAASLFEIKSPATAEMEILRSRSVVGKTVDDLQLFIVAAPRYVPLVGNWMARQATALSEPGFLGMQGYVSGDESIALGLLEVPAALSGKPLRLIASADGYALHDPEGHLLVQGKTGTTAGFGTGDETGRILVKEVHARPGAHFTVIRYSRLRVIEDLQKDLIISEQGRQSGVIALRLQGPDPEKIARTLNAVGTNYVRQNTERKSAEAEKSLEFLNGFLPQLKKQLEDSELRFNQFRNQNGTFDLGTEGKNYLDTAVKLQGNLLDLQQKRREQSAQFTSAHPVMQTLDSQIAALTQELSSLTAKVRKLPNTEQDLLRLTRDVKVNGELFINLLNSAQQLRLIKEGKVGNVRVVDAPVVPERAVKPQRRQVMVIMGVLGLLLGMGLALLRRTLRPGVREPDDIESATGLHVIATVPHSAGQEKLARLMKGSLPGSRLLVKAAPQDASVESLRGLRAAFQFGMTDATNNLVLFTGPTPGIGKSFTTANFAAVLAAGGKRVLLIDADLRKGHLHSFFGLQRGAGLSELIAGTVALDKAVHRGLAPNLALITTGSLPENPGELLMSPAALQLLLKLSGQYDFLLMDTSSVLAVSDTQVLASYAGTVFLVARAGVTSTRQLQETAKRLARSGVQVKGVVFNDIDTSRKRHGAGSYQYEYGKSGA